MINVPATFKILEKNVRTYLLSMLALGTYFPSLISSAMAAIFSATSSIPHAQALFPPL
jgi:hypothetical protein